MIALMIFDALNLFTGPGLKSASSGIYFFFSAKQDSMKVMRTAPERSSSAEERV
jgi:hypothetical protein